MNGLFDVGNYFPDRPPTWLDVLTIIGGLVVVGLEVMTIQSSSLPAVATGVGGTALVLGPLAQTRAGRRIGRLGTEIGSRGRAGVIILFAIVVIVVVQFEATPTAVVGDFGLGVFVCSILLMTAHLVHERRVEGWFPGSS